MNISENLLEEHLSDLKSSGLNNETIGLMSPRSVSIEEAINIGYTAKATKTSGETVNILNQEYVDSCLLMHFHEISKERKIDPETGTELSIVKLFYKEDTSEQFKDRLPKYLCLPKSKQSSQVIHFPKCFDWVTYFQEKGTKPFFITEGIKKAEKACQEGIPCIAIWSIWCFNEGKLNETEIINELKEIIKKHLLEVYLVFDSDKSFKDGVNKAELSFANKALKELGINTKAIDIPQKVQGQLTKGLDDYLLVATKKDFYKLSSQASVVSTLYTKLKGSIPALPKPPFKSQPQTFQDYISELSNKREGCIELAYLALFCAVSATLRNKLTCNGVRANLYAVGLAPTTSGKSSITKECLKPLHTMHYELVEQFQEDIKGSDNAKSHELIFSQCTREGLIERLANDLHAPSGLFFATGEFETWLKLMLKEYNVGLSSFFTDLFDQDFISEDITKSTLGKKKVLKVIKNPAFCIGGVSTEASFFENLPKNSILNGFLARYVFFLGSQRNTIKPFKDKLDKTVTQRFDRILRFIEGCTRSMTAELDVKYSPEAKKLWEEEYCNFKRELYKNSAPYEASLTRNYNDYTPKLALIFEVVSFIEDRLLQIDSDKDEKSLDDIQQTIFSGEITISHLSLSQALEWVKYFCETDKYVYEQFITNDNDIEKVAQTMLEKLQKFPQGILVSKLKRMVGGHRDSTSGKAFREALELLKDDALINFEQQGRIGKVRLKPFLLEHK